MGQDEEAVARSFVECLSVDDQEGAIGHYTDGIVYHLVPGREPLVGKEAIRASFAGSRWTSSTIVNMASRDGIVFVEGVDTVVRNGREVTIHHSFVLEVDQQGLISAERDYWDPSEMGGGAARNT